MGPNQVHSVQTHEKGGIPQSLSLHQQTLLKVRKERVNHIETRTERSGGKKGRGGEREERGAAEKR